jgi:hypothetical protein
VPQVGAGEVGGPERERITDRQECLDARVGTARGLAAWLVRVSRAVVLAAGSWLMRSASSRCRLAAQPTFAMGAIGAWLGPAATATPTPWSRRARCLSRWRPSPVAS